MWMANSPAPFKNLLYELRRALDINPRELIEYGKELEAKKLPELPEGKLPDPTTLAYRWETKQLADIPDKQAVAKLFYILERKREEKDQAWHQQQRLADELASKLRAITAPSSSPTSTPSADQHPGPPQGANVGSASSQPMIPLTASPIATPPAVPEVSAHTASSTGAIAAPRELERTSEISGADSRSQSVAGAAIVHPKHVRFVGIATLDSAVFAAMLKLRISDQVDTTGTASTDAEIATMLQNDKVEMAVCNRAVLSKSGLLGPTPALARFEERPVMRVRGTGTMVAAGEGWITFNQLYSEPRILEMLDHGRGGKRDAQDLPINDRKKRVQAALWQILVQFAARRVTVEDFYLGKGSQRLQAFLMIIEAGKDFSSASRSEKEASETLNWIADIKSSLSNLGANHELSSEAYVRFERVLQDPIGSSTRHNAIFAGGMTHRLLSEDRGAAPLIDCDDLLSIASLNPSDYLDPLFPTNVLVISKSFLAQTEGQEMLKRLSDMWNGMVLQFRKLDPGILDWANGQVDEQMDRRISSPNKEIIWPPNTQLFGRCLKEQVIEFVPWLVESGSS
jgi:hypothetical protein